LTAVAQAEGTVQYFSHTAYIYRPDDKVANHQIPVQLGNILKRKAPDVALQAKDVSYVPDSTGSRLTSKRRRLVAGNRRVDVIFGHPALMTACEQS
jgi:hypothetical protein